MEKLLKFEEIGSLTDYPLQGKFICARERMKEANIFF